MYKYKNSIAVLLKYTAILFYKVHFGQFKDIEISNIISCQDEDF